jgi:hypothetical protein
MEHTVEVDNCSANKNFALLMEAEVHYVSCYQDPATRLNPLSAESSPQPRSLFFFLRSLNVVLLSAVRSPKIDFVLKSYVNLFLSPSILLRAPHISFDYSLAFPVDNCFSRRAQICHHVQFVPVAGPSSVMSGG